jgi:hypothetical protein
MHCLLIPLVELFIVFQCRVSGLLVFTGSNFITQEWQKLILLMYQVPLMIFMETTRYVKNDHLRLERNPEL